MPRHFEGFHKNNNLRVEAKFVMCTICGGLNHGCDCISGAGVILQDPDLERLLRQHLAFPSYELHTRLSTKVLHQKLFVFAGSPTPVLSAVQTVHWSPCQPPLSPSSSPRSRQTWWSRLVRRVILGTLPSNCIGRVVRKKWYSNCEKLCDLEADLKRQLRQAYAAVIYFQEGQGMCCTYIFSRRSGYSGLGM